MVHWKCFAISPEGSVPIAPELSITFSQPMVEVTSQEEAATNVPVKLNPQPPGKWRWLGTKTLIFDPDVRFPMATTYSVTVPAGTRAANGSTLATEKSWSFTTPPLSVKATYPSKDSTQPRDALMFIEFDQRIDPACRFACYQSYQRQPHFENPSRSPAMK